jgi:peptidoglycan hydrolase-like protein with peptidoglycan-binding domain
LVSVAEGEATLTAQEQTVTVKAGEQATVEVDRPPSLPEPMSDQERALWATEGEMPELAPPAVEMWSDVYCALSGPAGNPASRDPWTRLGANVLSPKAVEVAVESPNGEIIILPRYSDFWGGEGRFHKSVPGLPQAGGTYVFTALDADGVPIPGAVVSDIYLGGHEPDPPSNVQARVVEDGILVTWNPSPIIPGAFDPGTSPPIGFYKLALSDAEGETMYSWGPADGGSQPETSHLIPFRRQDFVPGASGLALEEPGDGTFYISMHAFSSAPEEAAGHGLECEAQDPEEGIWIVIKEGQVQIENP